jgi:hypothetical protein
MQDDYGTSPNEDWAESVAFCALGSWWRTGVPPETDGCDLLEALMLR